MNIEEILSALREICKKDPETAKKLLATKNDAQPLHAFCVLATELGHPLSEMDLIEAGEYAYAAMRRSTNGGGENSPLLSGEDDYYELFMAELEMLMKG